MAEQIEIVEVGPRDGIQNESTILETGQKLQMIERLIAAGARRIEVGSFVNPRRVPQMAGTDELVSMLPRLADVTYIGLVMNQRGAERAIAAGVDELGAVCVASDSFAMRNQGQTSAESVQVAASLVTEGLAAGRRAQVTIGAAFGCPFEGEVPAERVVEMARALAAANPREIALADTIGVAVPAQVEALVTQVADAVGPIPIRCHFHDTRNTGIANVWAAVRAGVRTIDASLGGLGGCPFAPAATGNVATEDVAYMLERSGFATGYDLDALIAGTHWMGEVMGKTLPAMISRAGGFPPRQAEA